MKKTLSVIVVLALGMNLFAIDNLKKVNAGATPSLSLPSHIENNSRTEDWILVMADSYGDGWNGSTLDLLINEQLVLDGVTLTSGYGVDPETGEVSDNALIYFSVDDGDAISTQWTSGSSFDYEVSYGIYDGAGNLVASGSEDTGLDISLVADLSGPRMAIAGVLDLDLPEAGNTGKAVVVQALQDIADISAYGLGSANNGAGTDGQELAMPEMAMSAGDVLWVVRDAGAYSNYFGADVWATMNVIVDDGGDAVTQNGDDAIELFYNGVAVDVFGQIEYDGDPYWQHTDSWAHRSCDVRTPTTVFDPANWNIAEMNCTDDDTDWSNSSCQYPYWDCGAV